MPRWYSLLSGDGSILWTIWLGANDAAVPETSRHHVPLQEYPEPMALRWTKVVPAKESSCKDEQHVCQICGACLALQWGSTLFP
eukprot:5979337-Amphidinium_carterae.1